MYICPRCQTGLVKHGGQSQYYWRCEICGGHAISVGLLRQRTIPSLVSKIWLEAENSETVAELSCPSCRSEMRVAIAPFAEKQFPVDVCRRCHFLWFDRQEMEIFPADARRPKPEPELPQKAREALALWEVERIREKAESQPDGTLGGPSAPDSSWQWVAGLIGLPVEYDQPECARRPIATWILSAVIVLVSLLAFFDYREVIGNFGFLPSEPFRLGGLTWLSSFFLHGSVLHLLGNLYFLIVFGDNTEDLLGSGKFLLLLFLGTLVGDAFHMLLEPRWDLPLIGASGGISAVIGFYSLALPESRLGILLNLRFYWFRWIQFRAKWAFLAWLAFQLFGAYLQVKGGSNVSSLAHLGGVAVGIVFGTVWVRKQRRIEKRAL